jgi:hypothetical protein
VRTFRSVKAEYERLRSRYYLDAEPPLRVPPPAGDPALRWTWVRDRSLWGATHFDEDNDPHLIEVPWNAGQRVLVLVLLHELSHMRRPDAECTRRGWWREECRRLERADAFGREGVF